MSSTFLDAHMTPPAFEEIPMDTILAFIDDFDLVALSEEANNAIWADLAAQPPLIQVVTGSSEQQKQPPRKPKRVRREHIELRFLRQEVVALERKLSQFQQAKDAAGDTNAVSCLWKQVANQQIVERADAELENERLKTQVKELAEMRLALEMLLAHKQGQQPS